MSGQRKLHGRGHSGAEHTTDMKEPAVTLSGAGASPAERTSGAVYAVCRARDITFLAR